jgi:hypothetical protein
MQLKDDMYKQITIILLLCMRTMAFAQGYALDEVYKESSSRDSDYNPFRFFPTASNFHFVYL